MSSPNIDDLTLCNICCDSFDSIERCPRMLTCGHTFCHSCLQEFISRGSHCGTCRAAITYDSAREVPINYLAISFLEYLSKNYIGNQVLHHNGYCDCHLLPNHLKCLECDKLICGMCHFLMHRSCLGVFPVLEAKKKEDAKNIKEGNLSVTKYDREEKKYAKVNLTEGLITFDEWKEKIDEGSYCIDVLDFINSKITVIDTHKFIEDHKEELHNPKLPKDEIKFSQIEVKGRKVYFNSFKAVGADDVLLEFGCLLKTLECSSVIPTETFLKPSISSGGEVVIATDGKSPRALNWLLLTSGIMDNSYQGSELHEYGPFVYGGYINKWHFFHGVVEGIQDGGIYERKESKRGDVSGCSANSPNILSYFRVWTSDEYYPSRTIFGRVKRGIEVVDQILTTGTVDECGLLLDLS